ncbi:MAG: hypothetical protein HKP61_05300 [Dactylosporangium sp.]|nr:hypothetical protein [Dactylosporangium sp.]
MVALTVAYRRQRDSEIAEHREDTRLFTDRFGHAADQLGSAQAAVRVAGVYAMAELADDWNEGRQMCIDVLCAYLRMPYDPDQHREGDREVRRTTVRVIRNHLRPGWSAVSWSTNRFSFEGAVFDCGDLSGARFLAPGSVSFHAATFASGSFEFNRVVFAAPTWFTRVRFAGAKIGFNEVQFATDEIQFDDAIFSAGIVDFRHARVPSGQITFAEVTVLPTAAVEWGPFLPIPTSPEAAAATSHSQSRGVRLPSPRRSRRQRRNAR